MTRQPFLTKPMSLNVVRPGFGAQDPQVDSGWHESHVQFDPNSYERVQAEHIPSDDVGEKHKGARVHHDVFHLVHGKKAADGKVSRHIHEHGFDVPVKIAHLFKRPVVRQWIHEGNVYREQDERIPSRFELFFDLMFVGIAHLVAENATSEATGFNVLKFVLEYFPTWSVWMDVRTFLNVSGTDDVKERVGLLAYMILLNGYSANAAALQITHAGTPEQLGLSTDTGHLMQHNARRLFTSLEGESCKEKECLEYYIGNGYWLENGYESAIHAAIAFYLVLRLVRILLYVYYGWALPNFRLSMWTNASIRAIVSVIYIPLLFVWSAPLIICLMFVGMALEMMNSFMVHYVVRVFNYLIRKRSGKPLFIPALSLEHAMERTIQFVIVATGEMIISSTYAASRHHGLTEKFGRSSLGICCAFFIIWLYYDADSSRTFQHAFRRHAITSALFSALHFPLTAALILLGASLTRLVELERESSGYLWFWSGSCATFLGIVGVLALLHRNLDRHSSTVLPRWSRILLRFVIALIVLFLPLMRDSWKTIDFLGVNTALLFLLVCFETITKLGAVGRRYDPYGSQLVHNAKPRSEAKNDPVMSNEIQKARQRLEEMGAVYKPKRQDDPFGFSNRLQLKRELSWHPYEGLTLAETGEEDVGMEGELGHLQMKELSAGQRWAYCT